MTRTWTVAELVQELSKHPTTARIKIEDPDTNWEIPEFSIYLGEGENELWLYPCGYDKIGKSQ